MLIQLTITVSKRLSSEDRQLSHVLATLSHLQGYCSKQFGYYVTPLATYVLRYKNPFKKVWPASSSTGISRFHGAKWQAEQSKWNFSLEETW